MKIKRPLINQYYEEEPEPQEQEQKPLERPAFTHIKPLEEAKQPEPVKPGQQSQPEAEEQQEEVVIQTKPSEAFLKWKAEQEALALSKAQAEAAAQARLEQARIEKERKEAQERAELEAYEQKLEQERKAQAEKGKRMQAEPALPKTAVRDEDMPQKPKEKKKVEVFKPSVDQLEFGITPKHLTFGQRIQLLKLYFERRQEVLEISMLWKNPALPFNIISVIFVIGLLFIGGIFEFDRIPLKIPLFYNHIEKSWEQTDKSTMFILGIVLLLVEGFLINLITKIFRSDRRLALTLSWVNTFINILIIVAALQIYTLIT